MYCVCHIKIKIALYSRFFMAYAAFTHSNHFLYGTKARCVHSAKNDAIMWAATIETGSCLEYFCLEWKMVSARTQNTQLPRRFIRLRMWKCMYWMNAEWKNPKSPHIFTEEKNRMCIWTWKFILHRILLFFISLSTITFPCFWQDDDFLLLTFKMRNA